MNGRRLGAIASVLWLASCVSSDVSRELGARCDDKPECDERCLMPSMDYPDGFCSLSCADDDDCPSNSRCVADDGGVCLFVCGDDIDCEFLGVDWGCSTRAANDGAGEV